MIFKLLFLLLPAFAYGYIRLFIKTSTEEESHVEYTGANINDVGEEDLAAFGLDFNSLKQAIKSHSGAEPARVFAKAPSEADEEHLKNFYGGGQYYPVKRRIIPLTGSMLHYKTEEYDVGPNLEATTVLDKIYFCNSDVIMWTFHSYWKNNVPLLKGENILYVSEIGIPKKSPILNSSFEASFGKNASKVVFMHAGKEFDENLQKQEGEFNLKFIKRTVVYEVNYFVTLEGHVLCYFPEGHKGLKIWAYYINDILKAAGKSNTLEFTDVIKVEFYTDAEIYVTKSYK